MGSQSGKWEEKERKGERGCEGGERERKEKRVDMRKK